MADILIVEDKAAFGEMLRTSLHEAGFTAVWSRTGREGTQVYKKEKFAIALLDLRLSDIDGIDLLKELKKIDDSTKFVIMTAFGSIERAVEAMKLGAYDFKTKPFEIEELIALIRRILEERKCQYENILLKEESERIHGLPEIVGKSAAISKAAALLTKAAPTDSTILLLGESGTGKELFARAGHTLSTRKNHPFVALNCAAIPRELLENELFGSEKGAFTGAAIRKIGKFELADKGTIFLDEIADLDLELQSKILRVLQEMNFERLGGTATIKIDVRVIAATNQDLLKLVKEKKFREDLYYRLSVFPIAIPALRERIDDLPLLAEHILRKSGTSKTITGAALERMKKYAWPGNIRELENTLERALIIAAGDISADDILLPSNEAAETSPARAKNLKDAGRSGRDRAEAELIRLVLEQTRGNKSEASRRLGVSYKTLLARIVRYRQKKLLP
jgi:two-component system NtrC family response regulator